MGAVKSFIVCGQELAPFVVKWPNVEQIKDVLLAKTTLMSGEVQVECSNVYSRFSPEAQGSLLFGRTIFNQPGAIRYNNNLLFQGYLKDIKPDHEKRSAVFIMQDLLTIPADSLLPAQTLTRVNPCVAMLGLIASAGLTNQTDVNSFLAASAPSTAAGAVVTVTLPAGGSDSLLSALQALSELASVSVFVMGGLIRAKAYVPYGGNGSNLRQPIIPPVVRSFGPRSTAYEAFNNSVTVGYGSALTWTITDPVSIGLTKITRNFPFATANGSIISVPDLKSAQYFGSVALSRMKTPPVTIELTCGQEFMQASLGDRFPVTAPNWGYDEAPFELIETHHEPEKNDIQMVLRSLF